MKKLDLQKLFLFATAKIHFLFKEVVYWEDYLKKYWLVATS